MIKYLLVFLFISFGAHAQDVKKVITGFDPKTDIISDEYDAGPYLIYDCKQRSWVCVMEYNYKECQDKRQREPASDTKYFHSCAPIGKFPTKKSCFQRQLFMVSQNHGERFCVKDDWKKKAVEF